jgi:hypothetical protein
MPQVLITKAKLSEIAGVSRMAITKACSSGKRLEPAMVGKYVNGAHPEVVAYLKEKGIKPPKAEKKKPATRKPRAKPPARKPKPKPRPKPKPKAAKKTPAKTKSKPQPVDTPEPEEKPEQGAYLSNWEAFLQTLPDAMRDDVRQVEHLTMGEFISMFGSQMEFKEMANGLEKMQRIYKLTVENKKSTNELIDRAILTVFVEIVNSTHNKLLRDGSLSMASIAERRFKAGCSMEDIVGEFRKQLTKFFSPMKEKFKRRLEALDGP